MPGAAPHLRVFTTALIYVGIFLVRRPLPALAYFLKVTDCQTQRPNSADAFAPMLRPLTPNNSFRVTNRESDNGGCKESPDWLACTIRRRNSGECAGDRTGATKAQHCRHHGRRHRHVEYGRLPSRL